MKSIKRRIITGVFAFVICMIFLLHSVSADTEDAFFEMPLGYQTNSRIKATCRQYP